MHYRQYFPRNPFEQRDGFLAPALQAPSVQQVAAVGEKESQRTAVHALVTRPAGTGDMLISNIYNNIDLIPICTNWHTRSPFITDRTALLITNYIYIYYSDPAYLSSHADVDVHGSGGHPSQRASEAPA